MRMFFKIALACIVVGWIVVASWPAPEADEETAGLLTAEAADLQQTLVTAHLDVPLDKGKNVLWCGTFQLAWNEVCSLVGEDIHFAEREPPEVGLLNQKSFTRRDLDEASYVAVADFVRNNVHARIRAELDKKFHGEAAPRFIPPEDLTPRPQDIVAYCYLFKKLSFPEPFERIDKPIVFGGSEVPCFGIGPGKKAQHAKLYAQVAVLYYENQDDFAVELKTKAEGDRLLLAKLSPEATLRKTIERVQDRAGKSEPHASFPGDILEVPKLNFDITRRYAELQGQRLSLKNPQVAKDLMILSALQNIRFLLNEKGVKLRSEAHIAIGGCSAEAPRRPARQMIFDKPFLTLMQRAEAKTPYFALWVDNPEILVHTGT